ncbi:phage head-tail connector protein [uncultured Clostridium sp.]|uniref:phage head-tail connector protein n=1 Tax=uncultured Clostridium sp. TaxID=59620 RepID=UPI0028EB0CE9|nr:phage head-tail connector protein [uncultured Clostridium sp.]
MLNLQKVKTLLQIEDENLNNYIETIIPNIEHFVRDYIHLKQEEEIPIGLELAMTKMIEYNLTDAGSKRRKIKDVDIEFNTDYPTNIYKSLNKYRRLQVI